MQVILIAVISLDGRLTAPDTPGPSFASSEDQVWFKHVLLEFDCAVMGRTTFDTAQEHILASPRRHFLRLVLTRSPERMHPHLRPGSLEAAAGSPAEIVAGLKQRNKTRCALLGGGQVYREFLDAGVVDALWLTVEPVILGGGTPLVDGGPMRNGRFKLGEMRLLGPDTLLLNYQRPGGALLSLPFA